VVKEEGEEEEEEKRVWRLYIGLCFDWFSQEDKKKKIWFYLYCHVAGAKRFTAQLHLLNSLSLSLSLSLCVCLTALVVVVLSSIKAGIQLTMSEKKTVCRWRHKKPTRHLQQPVNQRKFPQLLLHAVTLADDTELYILPAMDELMMVETCEDWWWAFASKEGSSITQHLQWLSDLGIIGVFFFLFGVQKWRLFWLRERGRFFMETQWQASVHIHHAAY
jgi:hypothetical protein